MEHHLIRRLLLVLSAICALGLMAGCKANSTTANMPTATKSIVQITLQNTKFGTSEPLGILIKNNSNTDVYTLDGKASCTILQLQQYSTDKKTWVGIDACHDIVQPHVLVIRAGMSEPFTLAPGSASDPNAWGPGNYRIALSFSLKSDGTSAEQVAYSQGFTIPNS